MYANELSNLRYAVIEARGVERSAERFAIGYHSEESLRELIVDSGIVGCGFISRQEALVLVSNPFVVGTNAVCKTEPVCEPKQNESGLHHRVAELPNCLKSLTTIPGRVLHQVAAAFVLIAYSTNVLSMALRALIGV